MLANLNESQLALKNSLEKIKPLIASQIAKTKQRYKRNSAISFMLLLLPNLILLSLFLFYPRQLILLYGIVAGSLLLAVYVFNKVLNDKTGVTQDLEHLKVLSVLEQNFLEESLNNANHNLLRLKSEQDIESNNVPCILDDISKDAYLLVRFGTQQRWPQNVFVEIVSRFFKIIPPRNGYAVAGFMSLVSALQVLKHKPDLQRAVSSQTMSHLFSVAFQLSQQFWNEKNIVKETFIQRLQQTSNAYKTLHHIQKTYGKLEILPQPSKHYNELHIFSRKLIKKFLNERQSELLLDYHRHSFHESLLNSSTKKPNVIIQVVLSLSNTSFSPLFSTLPNNKNTSSERSEEEELKESSDLNVQMGPERPEEELEASLNLMLK